MKKASRLAMVAAAVAVSAVTAFGQAGTTAKYPFPQDVQYPHGHMPSTLTSAKAQSWYGSWKTERLKPCAGKGYMPTADNDNQVKVEGMGWAMIASAYMGDKGVFDSLYMFYNSKTTSKAGGMMGWDVSCGGITDTGSAADGDLDVAFGLVVASWQWGGKYLDSARVVINRCKKLIVNHSDGVSALAGGYNGSAWGGKTDEFTDISYYTPAFFKVFAQFTNDDAWTKLAEDTYTHLQRNAHPVTGLVSGWQNASTGAAMMGPGGTQNDSSYNHDASRVPWRIALDYFWNGEPRAKEWATKLTNWAYGYGINNLKEGHNRDGTVVNNTQAGFAFLGGWAVGAMTNDSVAVRAAFESAIATRNDDYWYSRSTGNMYWLAITGNMWNEDLVGGEGFRLIAAVEGGGSITRVPGKTKYDSGETVTLTAVPNTGWAFAGWAGDVAAGDVKNPIITVTMTAEKSVTAKFKLSATGENLVKNGDFSQGQGGLQDWALNTWGESQATASVSNGALTINISKLPTTDAIWDLQLVQPSLPLLKGNTYEVSFEASAAAPRTIQVMFQHATTYATYYSTEIGLTSKKDSVSFQFDMDSTDDLAARICFNIGNSSENVTIGNVKVILVDPDGGTSVYRLTQSATAKKSHLRVAARKSAITVKFKAQNTGVAEIRLYGLKGGLVAKTALQTVKGKSYAHVFNAKSLPKGLYLVALQSNGNVMRSKVAALK
jgi:uncharacterized repeat protein (TIGR02543 family)